MKIQFASNSLVDWSRSILARYLGQPEMYAGDRDLNNALGYPDKPSSENYIWFYERFGVATRLVNILPDESWKVKPSIYETEDPEDITPFEQAVNDIDEELHLFAQLHRIDKISGIGRFGILFLGFSDGGEGVNGLKAEVQTGASLNFVRPFMEADVMITSLVTDPANPRYGMPEMYQIQMGEVASSGINTSTTRDVHWSRVLHVADNLTSSNLYGEPRLKPVYNRLLDLRKVYGTSAEMFWLGAFPAISFEVDADADDVDSDAVQTQMDNFRHNLSRFLKLQGVTANQLNAQIEDPEPVVRGLLQFCAVTYGIPMRIFLGSEQAQLASEQDTRNWNIRVARRQNEYLTPFVIRPLIQRLLDYKCIPATRDGRFNVVWPNAIELTPKESAEVAKIKSEALKNYAQGSVEGLIDRRVFLGTFLGMSPEELEENERMIDESYVVETSE